MRKTIKEISKSNQAIKGKTLNISNASEATISEDVYGERR